MRLWVKGAFLFALMNVNTVTLTAQNMADDAWQRPNVRSRNVCNCVLYARDLVPSLPRGLNNYRDKLNIINTKEPRAGFVAVMWSPSGRGHVGVVTEVHDDGTITLEEGNYHRCESSSRTDMPEKMRIDGYFAPKSDLNPNIFNPSLTERSKLTESVRILPQDAPASANPVQRPVSTMPKPARSQDW